MFSHLAALGLFVFSLDTVPYQQLQRSSQWRHPSNARVGKRPSRQFAGPGDDDFTLSGTLYPELTGGRVSLALLRTMADTGKAWPLIEGSGILHGMFVIESIEDTGTLQFADGAPRKIDFSIKLARVDDGDFDLIGVATDAMLGLLL